MERCLKILAVGIGGAALSVLFIFGFAIWVFIPLFPAAVVYLIAVSSARRTTALPARQAQQAQEERKKAA
jgi:hypothetical protein